MTNESRPSQALVRERMREGSNVLPVSPDYRFGMRKAKIICTIGPASASPEILDRLIQGGMNAARLNFSHGSHDSHKRAIKAIREAAHRVEAAVAIIQDLQGPRIRIGDLGREGIEVGPKQCIHLIPTKSRVDARSGIHFAAHSVAQNYAIQVPVTYPHLAEDVKLGARVLIDDGLVELMVSRIADSAVECTVVAGGKISSYKGINLPGTFISEPTITDKDREDLQFGLAQGVDYVALSFVRGPDDLVLAKNLVADCEADVAIIAKIERPEAVDRLDELLEEADGVMVARGDLGVEMGPERVPILQKRIIAEANRRRRLVITATQMLESMTHNLRPTRAEASDVANAIFDGTDALMLSAETSIGEHPVEAVQVMDRIICEAEKEIKAESASYPRRPVKDATIPEAVCAAAATAASDTGAAAIVAFSESGSTARLISKRRPVAPIIAFTYCEEVRRRMALYPGVTSFTIPRVTEAEERVQDVERRLREKQYVVPGDRIVIVSGTLTCHPGGTNSMKLHEVE